ncbi:DUF4823 domain-containing protein [Paraburkholderia diazotrophica]|uniref:DUF4823 domain-containing protein n=1 Tax=Paraburkholderia diazotrophica TaxID=667676 RepID=A0A1H6V751_9BURK|nr:DUF4823 domain-containing protein [Paraburkholderia diazotrophica]SEI96085.1 protein of unknown function [Paraburkholderia diazotrophica]
MPGLTAKNKAKSFGEDVKKTIIALCVALTACTASYQNQDLAGSGAIPTHLSASSLVYVAMPADGAYESTVYPGSGRTTAQAVAAAFARHGSAVTIADATAPRERVIADARAAGAQFAAVPVISHWEPRATEWSGRPSRMSVSLAMIDVPSGAVVSNVELSGRSRIISFTSTSPDSLLREPIGKYVDGLYSR